MKIWNDMGKKQQKSPVKPLKAGSATKPAKGKASVKKRPASATAVRDAVIDEAEQKRTRMQENLWALEKQIYDIETRYLTDANPRGNAVRGYEGFLNIKEGRTRRSAIKKDDRLFSNSSATGCRHLADLVPAEPAPDQAPAPETGGAPGTVEAAEDSQL